jgi:hypothetical protein
MAHGREEGRLGARGCLGAFLGRQQFGLVTLALGDVRGHADIVLELAVRIAHGIDGQECGVELAVLTAVDDLAAPVTLVMTASQRSR